MAANKSGRDERAREERELSAPILHSQHCEDVVWELANKKSASNWMRVWAELCPDCAQKLAKLSTR